MENEIVAKPEPVWLVDYESQLTSVKCEPQPMVSETKEEFMMDDGNHAHVNNEGSLSLLPNNCDEFNEEVKPEIKIEEGSIPEDGSEFIRKYSSSGDVCILGNGANFNTSTDEAQQTQYINEMLETEEQNSVIGNMQNLCKNSHVSYSQSHTSKKPFKCEECSNCFKSFSDVFRHMSTHTGDKPYKCEVCAKCFKSFSDLLRHSRTHTGDKPHKCEVCGKCYSEAGSVTKHMRTHTGDKPFKCEVCGKGFTVSGSLAKHMSIHTGDKPFKCEVCGKCFPHSSSLVKHMRIHTGDKPFKCNVCSKSFSDSSAHSRHMRIHTGYKPFKCKVCGKCFSECGNLTRHMMTHT